MKNCKTFPAKKDFHYSKNPFRFVPTNIAMNEWQFQIVKNTSHLRLAPWPFVVRPETVWWVWNVSRMAGWIHQNREKRYCSGCRWYFRHHYSRKPDTEAIRSFSDKSRSIRLKLYLSDYFGEPDQFICYLLKFQAKFRISNFESSKGHCRRQGWSRMLNNCHATKLFNHF